MKALTKSYIAALDKLTTHGSIVVENYANDKFHHSYDKGLVKERRAELVAEILRLEGVNSLAELGD